MAMNGRLAAVERVLNVLVSLAIVVVAVVVLQQRLFAEPSDPMARRPARVENWVPEPGLAHLTDSRDRKVQLVVVEDPECTVCRKFHSTIEQLPDSIRADLSVTRVFVALSYHKAAPLVIKYLECAGGGDQSARLVDTLYSLQDSLASVDWPAVLRASGFQDPDGLAQCAMGQRDLNRAARIAQFTAALTVTGTPTVFIDGWQLPYPPAPEQLEAIVNESRAGRNPFRRSHWNKIRLPSIRVVS